MEKTIDQMVRSEDERLAKLQQTLAKLAVGDNDFRPVKVPVRRVA